MGGYQKLIMHMVSAARDAKAKKRAAQPTGPRSAKPTRAKTEKAVKPVMAKVRGEGTWTARQQQALQKKRAATQKAIEGK